MSAKTFQSVFVPLCILIPIILALVKLVLKELSDSAKVVLLFLTASAIINTASTIIGRVFHMNNLWLSHVYNPIEMAFIAWYFYYALQAKKLKKWYVVFGVAFAILCIANTMFFQQLKVFSSYTRSLESLCTILFALNLYARLAAKENEVTKNPDFYFTSGFFLYFSGSFMLFLFSNFSIFGFSASHFSVLWNTHAVMLLLMYILMTIGFVLCRK